MHRLAERATEAGVVFVESSRVESLAELQAEGVLIATDGYPSGLLGSLEGLIIPTRGQMIATKPIEERLFDCPHYGRHGFDYWQQTPDGRILAGGFRDFSLDSEFTADEQTTPTIQGALESFVAELVGRPLEVTHRWAGIFGLVLDFLPVVGRVPDDDRAWVAGGYSGHGNVLGFMCGDLVARAMLGDSHPLLATFDPARLLLRQVELGRSLDGGERDREILNREAGRVEHRDLVFAAASFRGSGEHVSELRCIGSRDASGFDGVRKVAVVRRLLPVVAEDADARELLDRDLGLARAVGAHEAHVLPRTERTLREDRLTPGSHGDDDRRRERLGARDNRRADFVGDRAGARLVDVVHDDAPPARGERSRDGTAVHAGADHGGVPVRSQRLRCENRRRAGAQRRDGARVERSDEHPVRRVRQQHESRHRRQPLRRIAGERGHPLQQRVPAVERLHRAEVARWVRRHVHLRRHRPIAARIRDEPAQVLVQHVQLAHLRRPALLEGRARDRADHDDD